MRHRSRVVGLNEDRWCTDARAFFIAEYGDERARQRQAEIDALPRVLWKGRTLYQIRCDADFGNGPHLMNVPESLLWSLISIQHYRCVYHR